MASRYYYTLIASLPPLPPEFDVDRVPIARSQLEERLKLLADDDLEVVNQWHDYIFWDQQTLERTDQEVADKYQQLKKSVVNTTLWHMIEYRMDVRTIVAAVRRRRVGLPAPDCVGQWVEHIRRNYHHPDFQLQERFNWVGKFSDCLAADDAMAAQRLLFETNYQYWCRMNQHYMFSFEAVLLYLARWEIIERWTSRDLQAGQERFHSILTETLGEYAHLFQ